jgi:hypothetical protein
MSVPSVVPAATTSKQAPETEMLPLDSNDQVWEAEPLQPSTFMGLPSVSLPALLVMQSPPWVMVPVAVGVPGLALQPEPW